MIVVRLSALVTGRRYPQEIHLVLISGTLCVLVIRKVHFGAESYGQFISR